MCSYKAAFIETTRPMKGVIFLVACPPRYALDHSPGFQAERQERSSTDGPTRYECLSSPFFYRERNGSHREARRREFYRRGFLLAHFQYDSFRRTGPQCEGCSSAPSRLLPTGSCTGVTRLA